MILNDKTMKKIFFVIVFTLVLFTMLQNIMIIINKIKFIFLVIKPFIIGLCFAFILNVPLSLIEDNIWGKFNNKKLKRFISIFLTLGILSGIMTFLFFLVMPQLKETIEHISLNLSSYLLYFENWTDSLLVRINMPQKFLENININWNEIVQVISDFLTDENNDMTNATVNITASIISIILNFFIGIIFSIYLLFHKEKLNSQLKRVLYAFINKYYVEKILRVVSLSNCIFSHFVLGQVSESIIMGILCFIGMIIFSFPSAAIISFLVGFTSLVPVFGAFFGTAIGFFLILIVNPIKAVWFVIFIIILQEIEGDIIYPKVVGKSIGLPSIWVFFAVIVGGSIYGVIGMLFGVPLFSIFYCLFRELVNSRVKRKNIKIR